MHGDRRVVGPPLVVRGGAFYPNLPGRRNHLRAGVLVPVCFEDEPTVYLTERPRTMPRHAGEVSFPGGLPAEVDADLEATARREAEEEIGVRHVRLLGRLASTPLYTSDYRLEPFVASVDRREIAPDPREVARLIELSLFDLVFADAPGGKWTGLDSTISALNPGGVLVVDDMDPGRYEDAAQAYQRSTRVQLSTAIVTLGLHSLQHRGQQSSGIAINDGGSFKHHRDNGLTGDVFSESVLRDMKGHSGIGHVRSAAEGFESRDNAQPMLGYHVRGRMALAFNGALANGISLRRRLVEGDVMFTTMSDAEIIGQIIVHERIRSDSTDTAVVKAMSTLSGAYSMVVLCAHKLIAARDPMGIRPLCMGHLGNATIFASESCAIRAIASYTALSPWG